MGPKWLHPPLRAGAISVTVSLDGQRQAPSWATTYAENFRRRIAGGLPARASSEPTSIPSGGEAVKLLDLTGRRFGFLTVRSRASSPGKVKWVCDCDCGTETTVASNNLRSGNTRSCGCKHRLLKAASKRTHGHSRSRTSDPETKESREYVSWCAMIARCTNPKSPRYADYGGRGIQVCARWRLGSSGLSGFECFLADMGERPPGTSLDRYPDNDGNYEPSNCRWATAKQQRNNRRDSAVRETAGGCDAH